MFPVLHKAEVLDVQDPDDVVPFLFIDRQPCEMLIPVDFLDCFIRIVYAYGDDVGTGNADIPGALITEIVHIIDHFLLFAGGLPVLVADIDHGADLVFRDRGIPSILWNAQERHHPAGQQIDQKDQWRENDHEEPDDPGIAQGQLL